jgi:hypothetical protein
MKPKRITAPSKIITLPRGSFPARIPRLPGLADPYLKLGRAKMHLDALDALLKEFTGPKAYTVRRYDDLKQKRYCFECELLDVPDDSCLTAGDAFYNMRSCLDQLVWSLSGLTRANPPETTQFPIFNCPPCEDKDIERWNRQIAGVPPKAIEKIKSFQPYHRGKSYKAHPLWRLNALCNLDKHRRIPANGSEVLVTFPNMTRGDLLGLPAHGGAASGKNPLDLRVEAFDDRHIVSVPLADKGKLQLNPSISFKVNFGQGDARHPDKFTVCEDGKGLWDIYKFVADVVLPGFLRFFP